MNRRAADPLKGAMLRPFVLAAVGLASAALASAAPQQQPKPTLLLYDRPSGQLVADAEGHLQCDPEWNLPALRGAPFAPAAPFTSTSDQRGILRFAAGDWPRAGSVLVTTKHGLGAVVPRLLPGEVPRIVLQPMAEVTTTNASEPLVLWAALRAADGQRIALPPLHGERVRLPAGSYEVWAQSSSGWLWQRLELASGQSHTLRFEGPAQRLRRGENATVHPSGFPATLLLGPGAEECVLIGGAIAAPLAARVPASGRVVADAVLPGPTSHEPIVWPPPQPDVVATRLEFGNAPVGTTVFSLRATEGDGWRVLGAGTVRTDGSCELPQQKGGDDWLLALAADHAPLAVPWSEIAAGRKLALSRGVPLVVVCTTEAGEPAIDLVLDYAPEAGDVARTVAHSDGRGRARFAALQAPGVLRVSDARFANQEIAMPTIPLDGITVTLARGARLLGKAVQPDGAPLGGVVVTLRDPTGRLRPASRTTTTAADGAFTFAGLSPDFDLVLFATTTKDERTWSGRLSRARAGGEPIEITMRSEDPDLDPARGR